jgi:carbonic anhydrase
MITKLSHSLTKLAKKYNLAASTISNALKTLNIDIVNEQNMLRFNEHVFDIIDTEEKAY